MDAGTCRYLTVIRTNSLSESGGEYHVLVRWSEMEALVRDLRACFPSMPGNEWPAEPPCLAPPLAPNFPGARIRAPSLVHVARALPRPVAPLWT